MRRITALASVTVFASVVLVGCSSADDAAPADTSPTVAASSEPSNGGINPDASTLGDNPDLWTPDPNHQSEDGADTVSGDLTVATVEGFTLVTVPTDYTGPIEVPVGGVVVFLAEDELLANSPDGLFRSRSSYPLGTEIGFITDNDPQSKVPALEGGWLAAEPGDVEVTVTANWADEAGDVQKEETRTYMVTVTE